MFHSLPTYVHSPDLSSMISYEPQTRTLTLSSLRESSIRTLKGSVLSAVRWSPDSQFVALGFAADVVLIYQSTGTLTSLSFGQATVDVSSSRVAEMAWSRDGVLAIATNCGHIRLLPKAGCRVHQLKQMHPGLIHLLVWEPSGSYLASASTDGTIVLWDGHSGAPHSCWQCPLPVGELCWKENHVLLVKQQGLLIQAIPLRPARSSSGAL